MHFLKSQMKSIVLGFLTHRSGDVWETFGSWSGKASLSIRCNWKHMGLNRNNKCRRCVEVYAFHGQSDVWFCYRAWRPYMGFYVIVQNVLCMKKIWKFYWGIQICVLESLFNHCGFSLLNDCILQKVIFILIWETYKK